MTGETPGGAAAPPIIVRKRKGGHAAHHGGAWKVAYADFVTAMMALFIVLWLLSTSDQVKKAVSGYFRDPHGQGKMVGSGVAGAGESLALSRQDMSKLKDKLEGAVRSMPQFEKLKDNLAMTVTGEGLRLELLESEKGTFFQSGSPKPTTEGEELLNRLAEELGKLPNSIVIEGHTDSKPYGTQKDYSNWELSADRANAARRTMQTAKGLRPDQVKQVRGYADQHLRLSLNPEDPTNRRVSVIVQYQSPPEEPEKTAPGKTAPEAKAPEKTAPGKAASEAKAPEKPPPGKAASETKATPDAKTPEKTAPGKTASEAKAPAKTAPGKTASETKAPEKPAPGKAAPQTKAPERAAPGKTAPEAKAPEKTAPGKAAPAAKAPENKAPGKAGPEPKAPEKKAAAKTPEKTAPAKKVPLKAV